VERSDNDVTARSDTEVTERSDADVIAASVHRPAEFGAIFDRHATVVHRYVVRRLGPSEAESITGEVFRIAFERRASFDPARSRDGARPWLYGIATNLVAKQRRTEIRRVHAVARLAARRGTPLDLADDVAAEVDAEQRWRVVADALSRLPQAELDVLVLHVWEQLDDEDIATSLGIPTGTVRSRRHRARRHLHELIDVIASKEKP
jgi:RNA polymerase sigma-70 factor (ECF subfamily)